ncbi:helix-turn-helix domain-containing protein [Streptomyces sp. NBC_00151]|uniref:helix-turn-helix domain-containing protein n=1 Tax=Streptomyces sp. NBC_00151 TaxID=2975669 RepID=UPI002DDC847A|nr:helix-turn-helix domain-containing protein [Streptomyces sp. NBC_00151]WRZ42196.1 helix-turn-helix domain-containing protein [Streptomyces sp. NBC_00151]
MAKFRVYPTCAQEQQMLLHCAHARYVWNLAVEQHAHWHPGRKAAPGFAEQCRQLTEARREFVCSFCGFTCNADTNAATNVAAGQGGIPRPRRSAGAGGTTPPEQRSSVREPQPSRVEIPLC